MAGSKFPRFRRVTENITNEIALTFAKKTAWVERQIRQATLGNLDSIACPFCGSTVVWGVERLCCKTMDDVTAIFLNGMETNELDAKDAGESAKIVTATTSIPRDSSNTIQ